ncbi:hypothetical protein BKA81DRAFT_365488, partial [Phyllosticta paracitricarpa]
MEAPSPSAGGHDLCDPPGPSTPLYNPTRSPRRQPSGVSPWVAWHHRIQPPASRLPLTSRSDEA